jgi:hypothetical protein
MEFIWKSVLDCYAFHTCWMFLRALLLIFVLNKSLLVLFVRAFPLDCTKIIVFLNGIYSLIPFSSFILSFISYIAFNSLGS